MSEILKYLETVTEGRNLNIEDAKRAFHIIMSGGATPPQIAAFLIALKMKGETVDEITAGAAIMRGKVEKISGPKDVIDTCGTGGDNLGTLNISSAVALVLAGLGIPVAKHGNRAVSSKSGSADVLEASGVKIDAPKHLVEKSLAEARIGFLLATQYHKAMRHVSPVRKELGIRTIFNLLGPLTNPASAELQLIGVYERENVQKIAEVLRNLGSRRAWVVHGDDGLDELSISGESYVSELKDGQISIFSVNPEEAGLKRYPLSEITGGDARHNANELNALLNKKEGAYRDIVLLNAAASLVIADKAANLKEGVQMAAESIDNGAARAALAQLVEITNSEITQDAD